MKKITSIALALCVLIVFSAPTNAASFSIVGDVGLLTPGTTGGTLDIMYNPSPEGYTFANGGIRLELLSDTPGIITFTNVVVPNGGKWTAATSNSVVPNRAEFEAFSILTSGLNSAAPSLFATVDYTVNAGAAGLTNLSLGGTGLDPLFDGEAGDVTANIEFNGAFVSLIPEPGSIAMAGFGLIGLVLRRRNG